MLNFNADLNLKLENQVLITKLDFTFRLIFYNKSRLLFLEVKKSFKTISKVKYKFIELILNFC
jgi:hypothetical protein